MRSAQQSGDLDPSFSGDGIATVDFATNQDDRGQCMLVHPDGRILVGGGSHQGNGVKFALARLMPDGSLDATFGTNGRVATQVGSPPSLDDSFYALALQPEAAVWDPVVEWVANGLDVALPLVTGIVAARVDDAAARELRTQALALDDFHLTALSQATGLAGSVLIGFALVRGALGPEEAFAAAAFDNLWSLQRWGEDAEARARLDRQHAEFGAIGRYLRALQ